MGLREEEWSSHYPQPTVIVDDLSFTLIRRPKRLNLGAIILFKLQPGCHKNICESHTFWTIDQIRCLKPAVCITSEISALSNFEYVCLKCHIREEGEPNAYFFQRGEVSRRRKISERDSANVDTSIKKPTRAARDNTEFFFIFTCHLVLREQSAHICATGRYTYFQLNFTQFKIKFSTLAAQMVGLL